MSAEIIDLPVITKLDIPAEKIIRKAGESDLEEVVIVGFQQDGSFYFASNKADAGGVLWLFEMAKKKLLEIGDA